MGQTDLDNVHKLVTDVKKAERRREEELAVRQEVDAQYKVFKKDKIMTELHVAEGAAQAEDEKSRRRITITFNMGNVNVQSSKAEIEKSKGGFESLVSIENKSISDLKEKLKMKRIIKRLNLRLN